MPKSFIKDKEEEFDFKNISLYIPHVFSNISLDRIANIFKILRIGKVRQIDLVLNKGKKRQRYNAAYIHFEYWYDNVAARNFQERVRNPNKEARIIYDDPWYWIVLENKNPRKCITYEENVILTTDYFTRLYPSNKYTTREVVKEVVKMYERHLHSLKK
jgi:hypothetical protein